jgi:hypothetical protein
METVWPSQRNKTKSSTFSIQGSENCFSPPYEAAMLCMCEL